MGSVIDNIQCPNCGHEAFCDFYYKTGEEYINCNNCGYHRSATIINREKLLTELTDEDWEITELKDPYGAYRLKHTDSLGTACGSIGDEDGYHAIKKAVAQMENIEYFSLSRFVDGEIILETIIDNTQDGKSNTGI
jgi:Zn ribbon nucleic-acid-binding protein